MQTSGTASNAVSIAQQRRREAQQRARHERQAVYAAPVLAVATKNGAPTLDNIPAVCVLDYCTKHDSNVEELLLHMYKQFSPGRDLQPQPMGWHSPAAPYLIQPC